MVKMIVDPSLTNHPKFLALREAVGEGALEYLVRIWGHCQTVMKGGNWGKVTPHYVEMVAGWGSHWRCKGHLWKALLEPIIDGKTGFIEMDGAGNVIIHDWDEVNKGLRSNWLNGLKGGRPKQTHSQPTENPRVSNGLTQREPIANPTRTDRRGEERIGVYPLPPADAGSEDFKNSAPENAPPAGGENRAAESGSGVNAALQPYPPTPEEMVRTLMNAGLSLETARKYHAWHSEKETWLVRRGHGLAVRSWEREVLRWQSEDRGQAVAGHAARGAGGQPAEDLERINAELQWQEEPGRRERLNAKRRELEQVLGAGVCT